MHQPDSFESLPLMLSLSKVMMLVLEPYIPLLMVFPGSYVTHCITLLHQVRWNMKQLLKRRVKRRTFEALVNSTSWRTCYADLTHVLDLSWAPTRSFGGTQGWTQES
jgi:hypothetical protein